MELSFGLPNLTQLKALNKPWELTVDGAEMTRLVKLADGLGYAMVAVPEHHLIPAEHVELSGEHYFAAYPAMGYLAGATERIRVNSCIALLPVQHPAITAKALSTIDFLSGGRASVTFGVGWLEGEFDVLGVPFHERGAMAEEYIQAILALWTQQEPAFEGKYVSFRDVAFAPRPVQQPHLPVWFGGDAPAVLRRTARYATGWWPFLTPPEEIPAKLDYIRSQPDYNGRLTEVFYAVSTRSIGEGHVVQDNPYVHARMSKEELVDQLGWLAGLGVTMSGVPTPTEIGSVQEFRDHVQWVAEEIMPAVAGLTAAPAPIG